MFGKRKKKQQVLVLPVAMSSLLESLTSRSTKEVSVTEFEKEFFVALEDHLRAEGLPIEYFSAERMGSGSIRLNCSAGIIGTVHLRKRFGSIQYFTSLLDIHDMKDAPIEAIVAVIPYWVEYAKGCMRLYKAAMTV